MSSAKVLLFCPGHTGINVSFHGPCSMGQQCPRKTNTQEHWITKALCHAWTPFPPYWPCVKGTHRPPVDSPNNNTTINVMLWCFRCFGPKHTVELTVELPVIWDAMTLMSHHRNGYRTCWASSGLGTHAYIESLSYHDLENYCKVKSY